MTKLANEAEKNRMAYEAKMKEMHLRALQLRKEITKLNCGIEIKGASYLRGLYTAPSTVSKPDAQSVENAMQEILKMLQSTEIEK